MNLEKILLTEPEYQTLLGQVRNEDTTLVEISQKFADLTGETKRILDTIRDKSDKRKETFGIEGGQEDVRNNDHRQLPKNLMDSLLEAKGEADKLSNTFSKFEDKTNDAIEALNESKLRVMEMREEVSSTHRDNVFDDLKAHY